MNTKENKLLWLTIGILLLIIVGGGAYLIGQNQKSALKNENNAVVTQSSSSKPMDSSSSSSSTETSYSSDDSVSSSSNSSIGMDISEMKNGDFSSIAGKWRNKYGTTITIQESGFLSFGDVGFPIEGIQINPDDTAGGYLNRNLGAGTTPNTSDYVTFIPAGILISDGDNADTSKDRIGMSGTVAGYNDPQVFYRDNELSSSPAPTATEKDYMMSYAVDAINKYRKDINRSLATRQDYIADNFTSTSNSYYLDTVDYIVNQSEADGIKSYDSTTDSITDFKYTKYTITFTLNYTTTTNYIDGTSSTSSHTRYYTLKYDNGVFKIDKF